MEEIKPSKLRFGEVVVERLMEFEHVLMEGDGTAGAKAVGHM
jgi:hypothetical protein